MKFLAIAILSAAVSGQSVIQSYPDTPGAPDQGVLFAARDLGIFVGGKTKTFCPRHVRPNCPIGNGTVFEINNGLGAMYVEVPGGQQLYIAPDGTLNYTQAHSTFMPPGSFTQGFQILPPVLVGHPQRWTFTGGGASGFYACGRHLQIYADVSTSTMRTTKCTNLIAAAPVYEGAVPAWEYT